MDKPTLKRWIKISLRTLHLVSVAGAGGGIIFAVEKELWINYWWLALLSGGLMMLIDIISNPVWLVQVRGLVMYIKLGLLLLLGGDPSNDALALMIIIVLSGFISHAPGKLRYYSVYHRKVITSAYDSKG